MHVFCSHSYQSTDLICTTVAKYACLMERVAIALQVSLVVARKVKDSMEPRDSLALEHRDNLALEHKANLAVAHKASLAVAHMGSLAVVHKDNTVVVHKDSMVAAHKASSVSHLLCRGECHS